MNFTYPSYSNLLKKIGYIDSVIELNEVAVREFSLQAQNSGDFGKFLELKSNAHNIKVNFPQMPKQFNSIIARSYIAQVSQCLEEFLMEFQGEHKKVKKVSWSSKEGESKLETAFNNVDSKFKRDKDMDFRICDYYRLVRNSSLHSKDDKQYKKLNKEYKTISSIAGINDKYSGLSAPNSFDNINFDDFILYSRATKKLALKLCDFGKPQLEEIVDLVNIGKYEKFSNKIKRKNKAITMELRSSYGMKVEEAEKVIKMIDKF
jgi:hypothetical protein